jgi:hypothetical protein
MVLLEVFLGGTNEIYDFFQFFYFPCKHVSNHLTFSFRTRGRPGARRCGGLRRRRRRKPHDGGFLDPPPAKCGAA